MRLTKALAAAALAALAFGCGGGEVAENRAVVNTNTTANMNAANMNAANTNAAEPGTVSLGTITGNLNNYLGQKVTVVADVQEVHGERAFTLDEDDVLAGGIDNDVLVVGKQAGNLERVEDNWMRNKVRVTGTVRGLALAEIEREVGWDLDPKIEAELEDVKAVIVADSIQRVPNRNF